MPRNLFETKLQNQQRSQDLRKLNDALKHRSENHVFDETLASAKLAEAILRAKKPE